MRIAIINWSRRKVGGTETYLSGIIPELLRIGHTIAFWHELDEPAIREQIALPDGVPAWCVSDLGPESALVALRDWHPDLIYAHGLLDPRLEAKTLKIAPAVFFAHAYYGTCISGAKTFKNPIVTPCSRRFGWQCLLHYYPRHCGGWNPVTMLREYQRQSKRLEFLFAYKAVLTNSDHIRSEYLKHGLTAECAYYPVTADISLAEPRTRPYWRLLFLGRMDFLKGGRTFLDALPQVWASLDRPLRVTFAGDGPDRQVWETQAGRVQAQCEGLYIEFVGWMNGPKLDFLLADCDLLVVPSLWPEPFGLVGPEAGLRGVSAAAFALGGIPNWLTDGVNGHLAHGDPPTAAGLAEAIMKCLRDPATYARLRRGAVEMAQRFSLENHRAALLKVFEKLCSVSKRCGSPDILEGIQ